MNKFIKKNKFLLLYAAVIMIALSSCSSMFKNTFNELFDSYNLITLDVTVQSIEYETEDSIILVFEEYADVGY